MEQLQVLTERVGTAIVASLRGDVDMSTAHILRERLVDVLDSAPTSLVVDLSEAEFLDSSGLGVLDATARRATAAGCDFRLAAPTATVSRVLSLTALDRHWPIYPSVTEALAAPPPHETPKHP